MQIFRGEDLITRVLLALSKEQCPWSLSVQDDICNSEDLSLAIKLTVALTLEI